MAKTTAPLLSFDARGQIGKSVVFSNWKGVKYARQHVIPANPRSVAQTAQRSLFAWVHDAFKYLDAAASAAWNLYATGKPITGMNAFSQKNINNLKGGVVIDDIVFIPPVGGGPPNAGLALVPGSGTVQATAVPPTLPVGWSITRMIACAMIQQDPHGETEPNISATLTKAAAPWVVTFTGLAHGQHYIVGAGWEFTDANGKTAYGGSTNGNALTT